VLVCITCSILVLIGWQWRIAGLKGLPFQQSVVAPNTALCFIVCCVALLLLYRPSRTRKFIGATLAVAVAVFSGLTLLEYLFHINLHIDDVFFRHRLQDWPVPTVPGRFAIQSAIAFCGLGCAIALTDKRTRRFYWSDVFGGIAVLPPVIALLGYAYNAGQLHGVMSLPTIFIFWFAFIGFALARPEHGVTGLVLSPTSGGMAARQLISANLVVITLFGWVYLRLRSADIVEREYGLTLLITATLVAIVFLILGTAKKIDQLDRDREATSSALSQSLAQRKATEDRLNEGLETANAAIWDLNFQTGELYWSTCHYTLLGYAPQEVKPTFDRWRQRVHPEDVERMERLWDDCLKTGNEFAGQYRVVWPDSSIHWMETKGKLMYDSDHKLLRSIGGFVDITERKRSEEALMNAEKLAATGRMAATLAHEINNPLAAVTNVIYLLKSDGFGIQGTARNYLQMADDEIRRVAQLVQKTLSFYRSDSVPLPVKLADVVDEVIWLYQKRLRDSGITLVKQYRFEGEITCNAAEIRQVLTNVFVNAIDAVGSGGHITVRVTSSRARVREQRTGVRVTIADSGPGIPFEQRSNLFSPFFSSKGERGTGLGLWISKGIMDKNGGHIRFRSCTTEPSGTVFSIFIPDALGTSDIGSDSLATSA
jgi:PAS domain S-box-containing protein